MYDKRKASYNYDAIPAGYYDRVFKTGFSTRRFWHQFKFQSVIADLPEEAKTILDIGCGPGSLTSLIQGHIRSVGIDCSASQVAYAERNYGSDSRIFLAAEVPNLPFVDGSFDVVTMVEVLEHLPLHVVEETLSEVVRLLKPNGSFLITTPNYKSMWPLLERIIPVLGAPSYDEQHVSRFTPRRIEILLASHGFSTNSLSSIFILSPFVSFLSWRLGARLFSLERRLAKKLGSLILGRFYLAP